MVGRNVCADDDVSDVDVDGSWSTFTLRVGTPQQFVRTYVSFASYQTWVVLPQGCDAATNEQSCSNARGWLFNESASTTWDDIGIYSLWIERNLDYTGDAEYGYDTVGLGGVGEGGPTIENTTVGGLAVTDYYLGIFGINPKPTNFSSFNDPSPSYMTLLKEQNYIPSVSFGYTAGAPYRFTGILASLTLGGYDESRYESNNLTFGFAADNERDIVVGIQSISTESTVSSSPTATELLPTPIYAYIDSTIPQILLPLDACQAFEQEFGLIYDNETSLYLVNDTLHASLLARNPNVTFTLGQGTTGGETVSIVFPYAAFDLTAQPPYQGLSNSSSYFPLQRAENETQYTLGRTFLQEAYITVDYEAQRFNVSQCVWDEDAQEHIVAIPAFNGTDSSSITGGTTSSSSSSSLSGGAIAGIVIGAIAVLALIIGILLWHFRRSRKQSVEDEKSLAAGAAGTAGSGSHTPAGSGNERGSEHQVIPKAELDGSSRFLPVEHYGDVKGLLSPHPSSAPGTPGTPGRPGTAGYFSVSGVSSSPTTPSAGNGTHMTGNTLFSPASPSAGTGTVSSTSEADSKERAVYEMPGDMPAIREKDGRMLTEKQVLQHREKVYNGVDPSPSPVEDGVREVRRMNAEDIVRADSEGSSGRLRAFSFDEADDR